MAFLRRFYGILTTLKNITGKMRMDSVVTGRNWNFVRAKLYFCSREKTIDLTEHKDTKTQSLKSHRHSHRHSRIVKHLNF